MRGISPLVIAVARNLAARSCCCGPFEAADVCERDEILERGNHNGRVWPGPVHCTRRSLSARLFLVGPAGSGVKKRLFSPQWHEKMKAANGFNALSLTLPYEFAAFRAGRISRGDTNPFA